MVRRFGLAPGAPSKSKDDFNILSTPNYHARQRRGQDRIGQNVPFLTGSFTTGATTGTTGAINPFQTIERTSVYAQNRRISEGGGVKMLIASVERGVNWCSRRGDNVPSYHRYRR